MQEMSDYLKKRVKRKRHRRKRAHMRLRNRIRGTGERPRLAVFKSLKHVYAQVIDDLEGRTLVSASSLDPAVRSQVDTDGATVQTAEAVGKAVAERAKEKGVDKVVFDRGGYVYHGKVKALADAARENGLEF
jgi:large subunit ribosomal protein L18